MKKPSPKYWPIIGILVILGAIFFYLVKSPDSGIQEAVLENMIPEEGLKLENIHYVQDDPDEGVKWVLDAGEVTYSKDGQDITFRDFTLKLDPEEKDSMEFKGSRGHYNKSLGEIEIWGDLEGKTSQGHRFIASHLLYRENENTLISEEEVKLMGPFFTLTGLGMNFSIDDRRLRIFKDIKTSIKGDSFFS